MVYETQEKHREVSVGTERSLHAAIQASVTTLGDKAYAEIRRVKKTQQRKQRPFRKPGVPDKSPLLGPRWGATRSSDPSPSDVPHCRRPRPIKVLQSFHLYTAGR